jgi:hypothetical protein
MPHLRKTVSLALVSLMVTHLLPAALGAESVASQITAMPAGTNVILRLKNKQTMRGTRGPVSNSGFTLVDARTGEHQIAFDDVVSVKQLTKKSHLTRNILIGVTIGIVAVGITVGILLRCGSFGCG